MKELIDLFCPSHACTHITSRFHVHSMRRYKVRLMAPFNMRCVHCGDYIYKGKKFDAQKETVMDEVSTKSITILLLSLFLVVHTHLSIGFSSRCLAQQLYNKRMNCNRLDTFFRG